jgi:hypothetical protein
MPDNPPHPTWQPDARDQEPLVQRHPDGNDPTKLDVERTADEQSTVRNGGIGSGGSGRDPVLPADDSTLNTKI